MKEYKIWFPMQGTFQQLPIVVKATGLRIDGATGQKILYGHNEGEIIAIASAETTIVLITEKDSNEYMKGIDK